MNVRIAGAAAEEHERARRLAVGGDAAGARVILERLVAQEPNHLPFWLSLAAALRALACCCRRRRFSIS